MANVEIIETKISGFASQLIDLLKDSFIDLNASQNQEERQKLRRQMSTMNNIISYCCQSDTGYKFKELIDKNKELIVKAYSSQIQQMKTPFGIFIANKYGDDIFIKFQ